VATARQLASFAEGLGKEFGGKIIPQEPLVRDIIPTGSLTLDWALRNGGLESGCIYEMIGPPDSGKTSLAILMLAAAQRMFPDRAVAYLDLEKTFRELWATRLGLSCSREDERAGRWLHPFPATSEDASDLARRMAQSGFVSLIVIDSVGGMESAKVLGTKAGKDTMGKNAQVLTRLSKELATLTRQENCTILMINQPRANYSGYGGDLPAGPKALRHATTAMIDIKRIGGEGNEPKTAKFGDSEEAVSFRTKATIKRMKNGTPGRTAEFWFNIQDTDRYGPVGVFAADEYTVMGIRLGVIERQGGGSWYVVPGADKVNGRAAVTALLRERPDLMENVRKGVLAAQASEAAEATEPEETENA
jgi:recombination protein RecA